MAGGYLGKISAVVAANTGDYVRKLNDSASQTKAFARTISADLGKASREASRSIESILTPLQRFERAIQNAASQKLAFRGFDGAIETVEQLRKAIASVSDRPVELQFILDRSGLKNLEQIRQTIGAISEKNLQLALSVGGLDGLRKLRSEVQEVNGKLVNVKVKTDAAELDRLISVFEQISPERVRQLQVDVETRQIEQAVTLNKQLVSVATEITSAYGRAKQQFAGFALDVQAALGSGLKSADSGVLKILEDIENRIPITEARFNSLSKAAQAAVQAIGRVGEADAKAQSLSGGQNLAAGRRGDVSRELDRAQASQQAGGGLGNAADLFARQKAAAEALVVELGKMEAAELQIGGGVKVTTKEYERQLGVLRAITTQIEQSAAARGNADRVAAVITGNPQDFAQGRSVQGQLETQIGALNRSQRQDFKGLLTQANDLSVGDRPENLERYLDVLQKIQLLLAKTQRVNVSTEEAQADADRLKKSLDALRQNAEFIITGRPQNIAQVQAELNKVLGTLDQLDEDGRVAIRPAIERVNIAVNSGQLDEANEAIDELRANASSAIAVTVTTSQAISRIDAINEAWDRAVRGIPGSASAIDAEFNSLLGRVANLNIADRLDLDPLIAGFRNSVAAGEPLIAQFQRLLSLGEQLDGIESQPGRNFVSRDGNPTIPLGDQIGPSFRPALDTLGDEISSTRRQIEQLDEPLRAQLGPEIDRITIQFQNMARAGIRVNADEARRLSREVAAINAAMASRRDFGQQFSERFGGAGQAGLGLGVDQRSLQAIGGQIEFVQERLSRLGAEARGPTLQALQRFREAARRLFDAGTIDTESGRAELAALRREIAATLSEAGGGSRRRILLDINRAGDVSRGGFDRFSLGVQQAAFAVEDFFSVTGGLDQRIRAAGNNISQLGFILGGTAGLIAGIAGAIGGQLVAALIKWADSGRSAEDRMKALNDSLSKQRSLVEELASAFKSLGDSVVSRAFSGAPARSLIEFGKQLDEITQKQKELRRERLLSLDEGVVSARASVNVAQRNLDRQTTAGGSANAQRALSDAQRRLREAEAAAASRTAPSRAEVNDAVVRAIRNEAEQRARQAAFFAAQGGGGAGAAEARRLEIAAGERRVQQFLANPAADSARALIAALDRQVEDIRSRGGPESEIGRLQSLIERLRAGDSPETAILDAANRAGGAIESAYAEVAEAIRAGIPGARQFQTQVTVLAGELQSALSALDNALKLPGSSEQEIAARDAAVSDAQRRVEEVRARADETNARADAFRRERTLFPQQQLDAVIERSQRQLDSIGPSGVFQQQQLRELLFQRETLRLQLESAPADPVLIRAEQELSQEIRLLASEINSLDETMNGFEQREARRLIGDSERGRELAMTEQQRANESLVRGFNDIAARFSEVAEGTTGLVDFEGQRAAQARFLQDQARGVAPLIFGFADERANALLQGPSRAALNVADAQTVEGARELNRLLRGDDPAKDVNLVELQRQSELLQGLLDEAKRVAGDAIVEIRG